MKPQPRYQPGDRIGGRYQVHKALMGGMGEVYLCLDLETNYPRALKTFQQRYLTNTQILRRAFEQEVATWVALEKHPNIVRCFYMTTLDNQPFMVLEWIAGEEGRGTDLRSWLRHGPLEVKLALEITLDICYGLLHAQAKHPDQRFVHRDLKPENILMAQGGLAKITDFGLAQIVKAAGLETGLESAVIDSRHSFNAGQGIAGTPAYMAPEQWRGEPLDVRTDIYALGCILYELITGALPFRVDFTPTTPQQVQTWLATMQQAHETIDLPTLPATVAPALHELLIACTAKALLNRPPDLHDLVNRLTKFYQVQWNQQPPQRPAPSEFTAGDYNNRGTTYTELGQHAQALADYGRALELDPTFAQAYTNRGITYKALGQHAQALVDYGRALELDPTLAQAYANRGNTYADLGQPAQSLADYGRALELAPTYAQAYVNRGTTYADLGQHAQALADYSRALELNPTLAQAYYNRGNAYQVLGQHAHALADYDRAIELDPTFAQAYANRGNTCKALGQHAHALADYGCALELDPADTTAYYNRGNTYKALGQHAQALADYGCTLELDPTLAQAYYNRGITYADLGKYAQALADYSRALEIDPTFAQAYFNLGALLANQGQLHEALPYLEKATQLGLQQAAQFVVQVRQRLGLAAAPPVDQTEQAFAAFQQATSLATLQQAVARFPVLRQPAFISAIEQAITQQVPPEQQPVWQQKLGWLRQLATPQ